MYKHDTEVNSREEKALFKLKDITGKGTNGHRLAINSFRVEIKRPLIIRVLRFRSQILTRIEERKCIARHFMKWCYVVTSMIKV